MNCKHEKTTNRYERLPPSKGRAWRADAVRCKKCGKLLELPKKEAKK